MEGTIFNDISSEKGNPALIMVMGVGGAGGNAIDHMWRMGIEGVNLAACNTDQSDLNKLHIAENNKVLIGKGLGAGNDAEVGENYAREGLDKLRNLFQARGTQMLFIAAGMGGGTGTGAAPVVAELAHEMGILTVAIVTTPPRAEGHRRAAQAARGVELLRKSVDSLIVLSNDAINELYGSLPLANAFDNANNVVAFAAKGIAEIITHETNLVNVDFSDVCTVMRDSGRAIMGVASETGEGRAEAVVDKILQSPLFGNTSIKGTKNVLVNLSVARTELLTQNEAYMVLDRVQQHAQTKNDKDEVVLTDIIWGMSIKPALKDDELEAIIVATGFNDEDIVSLPPIDSIKEKEKSHITSLLEQKVESRVERGVPTPIGRTNDDYTEILLAKRTPAYITHKISLTQAPLAKNVTTPKSAPADEGLSLFAVTNNAGEEANNE